MLPWFMLPWFMAPWLPVGITAWASRTHGRPAAQTLASAGFEAASTAATDIRGAGVAVGEAGESAWNAEGSVGPLQADAQSSNKVDGILIFSRVSMFRAKRMMAQNKHWLTASRRQSDQFSHPK